jgi:hypothetical protein
METQVMEIGARLEEKIRETRKKYTTSGYFSKKSEPDDGIWMKREIKKTEKWYRMNVGLEILVIGLISIVCLLKVLDVIPKHHSSDNTIAVFILVLNTAALVRSSYFQKIKLERLKTALDFIEIRQEIEKLKKH